MAEIWGAALAGAAVSAGASIYAGNKAASASQRGTNASISEQARQYDQTRADFAGQRSLGTSASDTLARLYGWAPPSQAAATEAMQADVQVGNASLPPGTTLVSTDGGQNRYYDVMLNNKRIGGLSPGGASGRFTPDPGVDINMLRAQRSPTPAGALGAGTGGAGAPLRPDMGAFFESPDYQFNLGEGQKAIDRSLAAQGGALSGRSVREGVRYASGMASQQFGDYTNRLLTIAGLGNAATSNVAAAGQNMANNNSAALINNANARASAYQTQAAGVNNAVQGGLSNYLLMQYLNKPAVTTAAPKV